MTAISIKAEEIMNIGEFSLTNSILMSLVVLLVLCGFSFILRKKIRLVPGKIQSFLEIALEKLLQLMDSVLGTRERSEKFLPIIATIFLFVLFSNWFGLLPGVGSFVIQHGEETVPLLRAPSSDLNLTLALAVIAVLFANIMGVISLGLGVHIRKYLNFSSPINFFIGILELLSEFSKIISFSFRLFGNIFAGEVLLTIIFFLVPYLIPLPFLFMEFFVGVIQSFIFAMLTLVFIHIHTISHNNKHAHNH